MPPRPRDAAPGFHHVYVNATGNWAYFLDAIDRMVWIWILVKTLDRFGWTCIAFCQMTTHVHLILYVPDSSLSEGMRYLNREYGKNFNARHDRTGNFIRKRYGNRRFEGSFALLVAFAYVVLNPVAAAVVTRAEFWRWSSFATTAGFCSDFPFVDASLVLGEFGDSTARLREFISAQATVARDLRGYAC